MAFDPSISPVLTSINVADTPSYGLPYSSNVIGSNTYNTDVVWGGPGGTFQVITTGNLASVAQLNTAGLLAIKTPGAGVVTALISPGVGISITPSGNDFVVGSIPNSTTQRIIGQYNGTTVGSARNTVNLIAGANVSVSLSDTSSKLNWTINADDGAPVDGPFITTTADSDLTGATNLGALSTGYLFNTVSAGVATISTVAGSTFATLAGTQTFSGVNTFSQPPVMSGASILPGTINITAINGSVMTLNTAQTVAGIKTFGANVIFSSGVKITTGAASGRVYTSDASGNGTWALAGGILTAAVSTTDATPTTLLTVAVPTNQAITISGTLVGRNTAGTINNTTGGRFIATAVNTAGTVTLAGPPDVVVMATSTGTFNVVVSTTNLVVQVTGIAATAYNWSVNYYTSAL